MPNEKHLSFPIVEQHTISCWIIISVMAVISWRLVKPNLVFFHKVPRPKSLIRTALDYWRTRINGGSVLHTFLIGQNFLKLILFLLSLNLTYFISYLKHFSFPFSKASLISYVHHAEYVRNKLRVQIGRTKNAR